mmetsp:Transcript_69147/g.122091  ORF Transcript_69147/g.122091 Transcript_69147/m.122091 type:complete len:277 (-) Transcript_69147:2907-3737(-)
MHSKRHQSKLLHIPHLHAIPHPVHWDSLCDKKPDPPAVQQPHNVADWLMGPAHAVPNNLSQHELRPQPVLDWERHTNPVHGALQRVMDAVVLWVSMAFCHQHRDPDSLPSPDPDPDKDHNHRAQRQGDSDADPDAFVTHRARAAIPVADPHTDSCRAGHCNTQPTVPESHAIDSGYHLLDVVCLCHWAEHTHRQQDIRPNTLPSLQVPDGVHRPQPNPQLVQFPVPDGPANTDTSQHRVLHSLLLGDTVPCIPQPHCHCSPHPDRQRQWHAQPPDA